MTDDPLLLTPGPLTTSMATKNAMLHDWGSRDKHFIELTARVCQKLEAIAGVDAESRSHVCVPIQGSGTFAVEATIDTLVPKSGKVLVLINGAYGRRISDICRINSRAYVSQEIPEDQPVSAHQVAKILQDDQDITHVVAVHCETTSGILNPIAEIAEVVAGEKRHLIVDAMSSFGALPVDVNETECVAIVASSNKCLQGVPGIGFGIIRQDALAASGENATSLSLDLYDQWRVLGKTGQWRFTPPTHVLAALDQALVEHEAEGGVAGRGQRYQKNCDSLLVGMKELGFRPYLSSNLQAPIIITFHTPSTKKFKFEEFYAELQERGYMIYPGKLTQVDSFRVGCIGDLDQTDIEDAVQTIAEVVNEMGVVLY